MSPETQRLIIVRNMTDEAEMDKQPHPELLFPWYEPGNFLRLLETELRTSDYALYSVEAFRECCPVWLAQVADIIKLGALPAHPRCRYSVHGDFLRADDPFGRTNLHYKMAAKSLESSPYASLNLRMLGNVQDFLGWTPLHYAASCEMATGRVFDLIQAGADVNLGSRDGLTPLHCAVMAGNLLTVIQLVKAGADVNGLDSWRYTALHRAALNGYGEIFDYFPPLTNPTLRTITA